MSIQQATIRDVLTAALNGKQDVINSALLRLNAVERNVTIRQAACRLIAEIDLVGEAIQAADAARPAGVRILLRAMRAARTTREPLPAQVDALLAVWTGRPHEADRLLLRELNAAERTSLRAAASSLATATGEPHSEHCRDTVAATACWARFDRLREEWGRERC